MGGGKVFFQTGQAPHNPGRLAYQCKIRYTLVVVYVLSSTELASSAGMAFFNFV